MRSEVLESRCGCEVLEGRMGVRMCEIEGGVLHRCI